MSERFDSHYDASKLKRQRNRTTYKKRNTNRSYFHNEDEDESYVEENQGNMKVLIDAILPNLVEKCSYETEIKNTYIWSGESLENKIKNHILILGYVDGLDYYIESIRWESGIPIILVAEEKYAKSISKLLNKYEYLYYYVDNPKVAEVLKKVNIRHAYHVLILSNPDEK